ncbi:MAG: twin-arginine translocase subunit TatC [Acidimicrobiales bacterium]
MAVMDRLRHRSGQPRPEAMTLVEHIAELRRRIIVCVVAFSVFATVAFVFYAEILRFLESPYCRIAHPCDLYVTGPLDGLTIRVKIAGYVGLLLTSPVALWELWRFVTPGLRAGERRYAIAFTVSAVSLFVLGAVLAFYTFPHALGWLQSIGGPTLREIYNPNSYLGLILALMAVFGVTFEFPVVLVALELAGVVSPGTLASWRRWAFFIIVVVAAIITPSGDPFSMTALAIPLYVFYEVSIVIGKVLKRPAREVA